MKIRLFLILYSGFCFQWCLAQPGALDLTFDPGLGADDNIYGAAVQADGKIVVCGNFTTFSGDTIYRIVRLNTDGSRDINFDPGGGARGGGIYVCAIQQNDGKIVIAGNFTSFDGTSIKRIARLNPSGSLDTTFNPGSGANDIVRSVSLQSNGKIIIAGDFTTLDNTSSRYIARLDTDGSVDAGFNPPVPSTGINATAIQSDGKILIGGEFIGINGPLNYRIARLNSNGSVDASFNQFGGPGQAVVAIAIQQNDGKSIIGGDFTTFTLNRPNHIARLMKADGTLDGTFYVTDPNGPDLGVDCIAIQADGQIIIGGGFSTYSGISRNHIARIDEHGGLDSSFDPGSGADAVIRSITFQSDGKIIIGGDFRTYNGISRNRIARIYACETPQPDAISGSTFAFCPGTIQTYSISAVSDADYYIWSLPAGWSGNSDSISITATSNGSGGIISVIAFNNACGYSLPQTLAITSTEVPDPSICLVTVDTLSDHNIVYWEKPFTDAVDSYFVYREVATDSFSKIAAIPYDSVSEYHDYEADPDEFAHTYKISFLDTCGTESALSDYHKTIHLVYSGNGILQWTAYAIENYSGIPVTYYRVYRDNSGDSTFLPISSTIPGSVLQYQDPNHASFPSANYVVDVNWDISCTPMKRGGFATINTTRSNIKSKKTGDNAVQNVDFYLNIYPNPAQNAITIDVSGSIMPLDVKIFDLVGKIAGEYALDENAGARKEQVDVSTYPKGIYTLLAETDRGVIVRKLFIQ